MITCRELAELLFDFTDGQLSAERQQHIEEHLGLCASCVAYLEGYRFIIQVTRRLPRLPLPDGLRQQLRTLWQESQS
jgi:anti-sigma factor RsiW